LRRAVGDHDRGLPMRHRRKWRASLARFEGYKETASAMLRVMRNHRRAANGEALGLRGWRHRAGAARSRRLKGQSAGRARAQSLGARAHSAKLHGYRNAQVTVVAPTGTIGLVMDCDTTGIEPDFALVKFKKLAGGGYFKIINRAVPEASARRLDMRAAEIAEMVTYATGHGSLQNAPAINPASLKAKGFTQPKLDEIEALLAGRLRHQIHLQQMDAWRGVLHQRPEDSGGQTR
jgi:ribonucleoside-diphosphate reductase alpha chain